MNIALIHIGKTGGTTINKLLETKLSKYKEYHHFKNYENNEKYIIWLRNPISRFVSAFNHSYYGVNTDKNKIKNFNYKNCLLPVRLKESLDRNWVFSERYDMLIKCFKDANHLAESLSSTDPELKKKAVELMNCREEHLYKGIGWYLNNGKFIDKRKDNILFVGALENMKEDINRLSKTLGIILNPELKVRENIYVDKTMKYLSTEAIKNIIDWYKDTDYKTLEILLKNGWITEELMDSYFKYEQ